MHYIVWMVGVEVEVLSGEDGFLIHGCIDVCKLLTHLGRTIYCHVFSQL